LASPQANQCLRLAPPGRVGNPDSLQPGRAVVSRTANGVIRLSKFSIVATMHPYPRGYAHLPAELQALLLGALAIALIISCSGADHSPELHDARAGKSTRQNGRATTISPGRGAHFSRCVAFSRARL